jgi:hypothetical protein
MFPTCAAMTAGTLTPTMESKKFPFWQLAVKKEIKEIIITIIPVVVLVFIFFCFNCEQNPYKKGSALFTIKTKGQRTFVHIIASI